MGSPASPNSVLRGAEGGESEQRAWPAARSSIPSHRVALGGGRSPGWERRRGRQGHGRCRQWEGRGWDVPGSRASPQARQRGAGRLQGGQAGADALSAGGGLTLHLESPVASRVLERNARHPEVPDKLQPRLPESEATPDRWGGLGLSSAVQGRRARDSAEEALPLSAGSPDLSPHLKRG